MHLRQLASFVRIVELRNMTRAAESLYVAQPALSQQVAALESELGAQLLVRNPRGVTPTTKGEVLYRQAKTILREVDAIPELLHREEDLIAGPVSIGMASSTARMLALPLIRAVRARYPAIDLEIVDVPSADLTLLARQGRVDIALSPDQENAPDLEVTPLLVEELLVLAPPDAQLPEKDLAITDLADVPLILSRRPNKLRMRVDYAFMNARLQYQLAAQVSTSAIALPAIREGLGAAILPYSAAYRDIEAGTIKSYRLTPSLAREICICISHTSVRRPAMNIIVELLRHLTRSLVAEGIWRYCTPASDLMRASPPQSPRVERTDRSQTRYLSGSLGKIVHKP